MDASNFPVPIMADKSSGDILSSPPFIQVEGVINIRTVGGFKTSTPSVVVKPSVLYRSGELTHITFAGAEQLRERGINTIFDLRSDGEVALFNSSAPALPGVDVVKVPISRDAAAFDPVMLDALLKGFATNEHETFLNDYADTLELAGPALQTIIRHFIDRPNAPCLIHCTAGKDRTGLVFAIMLMILGVGDQDIIDDYALTTVGLEPAIPMITARFQKITVIRDNFDGAINMGHSRPETMAATLTMIRKKYGSAERYLKTHTNLTDDDIIEFRESLLIRG